MSFGFLSSCRLPCIRNNLGCVAVVVDVHPNEKEYVLATIDTLNDDLNNLEEAAYEIKMNVPLLLEAKIGKNWLDIKDV